MIRFENVSKVFDGNKKAVDSVSFTIPNGEIFVLIGPSGCGKTTTLKMINRLIELSDGTIYINDEKVSTYNVHELRWNIGYVLQNIGLFPHMTIEENIAIVPEMKKWPKEKTSKRVDELLRMVGLKPADYKDRKPGELSGGQQQRIGVARALAADPEFILMDEPFSALDPITREKLQDDILSLQKEIKKTIVFVTHDMQEALKLGDRICLMKDGEVAQVGTPEELIHHPANEFVRDFIGEKGHSLENDFNLADLLSPIEEPLDVDRASIPIDSTIDETLSALAQEEIAIVKKDGTPVGYVSRETIIRHLAGVKAGETG
ncbi:ABC transporter ATP-binding protein [Rossellomorea marisflavi]|uniref:ABC transporter ATP-binding protein n=1 Tax=Rossellomorea marisflavi TaxID=189381 RepID=UPI0020793D53|nr:ABC transporter ATP-binding protein [Rossellomorea marisflavi]USK91413.1 ABC transporter ATP-binding protein [Rossellomorea marisflavi]